MESRCGKCAVFDGCLDNGDQVEHDACRERNERRAEDRVAFPDCDLNGVEESDGIERGSRAQPKDTHVLHFLQYIGFGRTRSCNLVRASVVATHTGRLERRLQPGLAAPQRCEDSGASSNMSARSAINVTTARQFFGRRGVLSKWHPNYEFRQGQLDMAQAIESALQDKRHLIVEAGTGTGKTLAYLIPAILSGRRVVISTGTKNLQEQLYFKDVPFLQKHLSRPVRVCYMKGRNNYACRQKIYDADRQAVLSGMEEVADFQVIQEW